MDERLAILFWFYKDAPLCRNHLALCRHYNPRLPIYGLYGGPANEADTFARELSGLLDDFYICPEVDPKRKWRHGDLMIADWHRQRGCDLPWDSIFVLQWDALVFADLQTLFRERVAGQIFLSGRRPLTPEWIQNWHWTSPHQPTEQADFLTFQKVIARQHPNSKPDDWQAALFVFEILTRSFLDQYCQIAEPETGFLEYKLPTYAKIWGFDFFDLPVGLYGEQTPEAFDQRPVNAVNHEIKTDYIKTQLEQKTGWRLFHPYFKPWPIPGDCARM